ncbi:three-Cys-motif partner protein TcmP [Candidatus Spongiihabitans sp.]|uniref:three-Cys-motif partner protein TcmP n=1 Tax=Candidatus Spongiihabitans sp. TaxID=3101308 RepID=UPI003C6EAAD3
MIEAICNNENWKSHRAVAFIDPFATQVKWNTIEKMASTKAIDLWLLFPAMAVNRMLTKTGGMPDQWQERLTECFGTDEWQPVFYQKKRQSTLFEDESSIEKVANIFEILSQFVNGRLRTIFPSVSNNNLVLKNSKNSPLFLLCFACSNPNPKAFGLAVKIANHIIDTSP